MPNVIKIKSNSTAGAAPSSLETGELAINTADGLLYYKNSSSSIAAVTDTIDGGVVSPANLLLLHFDGNSTDSSTYARTITAVGNATTSTTQKKFGTHSALFDGSGDRFDVPSSADFNLGGTDHTVDFWMWINSSTNGQNERLVVFEGTTQTRGLLISDTDKTKIGVNLFGSGWQIQSATGAISNQTWIHVALVRSGSTTTLYINGTSVGSTTSQCLPTTNSSVSIGGNTVRFAASNFNGYIDEVRIANRAVWTSNFTPETSAYSQSSGSSARTQTMKIRAATAATLSSVNPTPAAREPVYETDTRLLRVGDGSTPYNSLGYVRPQFGTTAGTACQGNDSRLGLAAWVNFDGTASSNLSGTYSQSGTTVTVTATAHGLSVGQRVYADITSGTGVDGVYTVATVTSANAFTYTAGTSLTTSGNVTLTRNTIRAGWNVSSVADNGQAGDYTINFATAMSDANYAAVVTVGGTAWAFLARTFEDGSSRSTSSFRMTCVTLQSGNAQLDPAQVSVVVFR